MVESIDDVVKDVKQMYYAATTVKAGADHLVKMIEFYKDNKEYFDEQLKTDLNLKNHKELDNSIMKGDNVIIYHGIMNILQEHFDQMNKLIDKYPNSSMLPEIRDDTRNYVKEKLPHEVYKRICEPTPEKPSTS